MFSCGQTKVDFDDDDDDVVITRTWSANYEAKCVSSKANIQGLYLFQ